MWYYIDDLGAVQGPFNSSQMRMWFDLGWFGTDVLLRNDSMDGFIPLGQLFATSSNAFVIKPRDSPGRGSCGADRFKRQILGLLSIFLTCFALRKTSATWTRNAFTSANENKPRFWTNCWGSGPEVRIVDARHLHDNRIKQILRLAQFESRVVVLRGVSHQLMRGLEMVSHLCGGLKIKGNLKSLAREQDYNIDVGLGIRKPREPVNPYTSATKFMRDELKAAKGYAIGGTVDEEIKGISKNPSTKKDK